MFVCPGCVAGGPEGYYGIHMLPVNTEAKKPSWSFNEDLEMPTLSPSILTNPEYKEGDPYPRCHSFLRDGVFEFLSDCSHPLAGQHVPMVDLPRWAQDLK
jgi:hypothetical protein